MKIPLRLARRIILNAQQLDGRINPAKGKQRTAQIINHLGYVQIDTIAVIERAHHHTLWTRQPDYEPAMLDELQAEDRRVFEYWGHAASYIPMEDYRFYIPRMRSFPWGDGWIKKIYEKHKDVMEDVYRRIRTEGPLGSTDFKAPQNKKRGTWWDWKPAKTALELLMWRGDLMVTRRRNFTRIYDLTERVLPQDVDIRIPAPDDVARFRILRALQALGLATEREIADHLHISARARIPTVLEELLDTGEVIKLKVEGVDKAEYYAHEKTVGSASRFRKRRPSIYLISPFDSMIIQRNRIKQLFNFSYTLECYLPVAKRRFGYFTLPVLWGEKLVARLDPKADRKKKKLLIRNLVFEPGFDPGDGFMPAFAAKLKEFAVFNNCTDIVVEKISPFKLKSSLLKTLKIKKDKVSPSTQS